MRFGAGIGYLQLAVVPPAQDSSHHQGLLFLIGNPNLNLCHDCILGGGDNPNMKLKTLVEKPGAHLRLATDIYLRSSIYNIDVCPLFQLDAVWPTQMQHKTKKTAKPPTKGIISHSFIYPWEPQKHIKNMHPRVTCRGKKKIIPSILAVW